MKTKGIGFFEQNVEKLVVALVGIIFLGVLAMQFLFEPNQVTVGKGDPVPPARAYGPVEARAQQLSAELDRTDVSGLLPTPPQADVHPQFKSLRNAPVPNSGTLKFAGASTVVQRVDGAEIADTGSGLIPEFAPPAPQTPVAFSFGVTFDPSEVVAEPGLAKLLPGEQPFDAFPVTVEALVDGTAIAAALASDPDAEGEKFRAIPTGWWRSGAEILGVRLERQERQINGSWGESVEVPVLPGRLDLVNVAHESQSTEELRFLVEDARRLNESTLRPVMYNTIAGDPWAPPTEAMKVLASLSQDWSPEIRAKLRDRDNNTKRLENAKARLAGIDKPAPDRGGGGESGGGGRRPGPTPSPDPANPGEAKEDPRRKSIEAEINRLEDSEKKLVEELVSLGYSDGKIGQNVPPPPRGATQPVAPTLLEDPKLRVWAHDLTATPGKTYRYRIRIDMNNPAFGRSSSLAPEQQEWAKKPVARGTPSPWTAPVEVLSDRYFFISGASDGSSAGRVSASFDVFLFHYGYYRKGTAALEMGDTIDAAVKLNEPNRRPIFDLAGLKATEAGGRVELPQASTPDAEAKEIPLPAGAKAGPKDLRIASPVYLMDVASMPRLGGGRTASQAVSVILANPEGQLIVQSPDEMRASELAKRVANSAKLGETQGDITIKGPGAGEQLQQRPIQKREREDDGGGGGAGGG
jgi:hypothetical protein